jgi:hypothetical protein
VALNTINPTPPKTKQIKLNLHHKEKKSSFFCRGKAITGGGDIALNWTVKMTFGIDHVQDIFMSTN